MAEATVAGAPRLPDVRMNLARPTDPVVGRIVRSETCTASPKAAGFVSHIEVDVSGTPLEGAFLPGQAFGVVPPGTDDRGKPHKVRLYSVSSPSAGEDGRGRVISTTVKRTIDRHWDTDRLFLGVASNYLCDLGVGDEVRVTGPVGKRFLLPEDPGAHDYLFVATGTGIAPFRGMLKELLASGGDSRMTLVMGAPYATDLLYHDELRRLDEQHERFTYLTAISRERQADGHGPMYVGDRIRESWDALGPQLIGDRCLVYVCGVAGMEVGLFRSLADRLRGPGLEPYLRADEAVLRDVDGWNRKMMGREVRWTERVMVEVYE
jgi:ferredoxin--NADP+ reductase